MRRIGDLLPATAAALGFEEELRLSRAMATWRRLVAEHVPPAAGATELLGVRPDALVVSASAPIVAQELRLRATELLEAFAQAAGEPPPAELRVVMGRSSGAVRSDGGPGRRAGEARSSL